MASRYASRGGWNDFGGGRGWSTPGLSSNRLTENEVNNVRVFSAKGISAPGVLGTAPLPQIGTPIPGTVYVYVRPRLSQDEGLTGGGGGSQFPYERFRFPGGAEPGGPGRMDGFFAESVHITNPAYNFYRRYQRTPSIGMAAAGQTGRNMTVPWEGTKGGYFATTPAS